MRVLILIGMVAGILLAMALGYYLIGLVADWVERYLDDDDDYYLDL